MTQPQHHFGPEALLDYAAGNAPEALSLATACHLGFCPACTAAVRDLESAAGVLLAGALPPPTTHARDRLLARLADQPPPLPAREDASTIALRTRLGELGLPPLLRHYLPKDGGLPKYRFLVPGVKRIDLDFTQRAPAGTHARVVRFRPGFVVPQHDHAGVEYTVVIRGSFVDQQGRFGPGDACVREAGDRHQQTIDRREECVALTVNCGALVPLTPLGRLLKLVGRV